MSSDPQHDPSPSDPAGGAGSGGISDSELDAVLAEAANLSDALSSEVGTEAATQDEAAQDVDANANAPDAETVDVEAQLDQLSALLDTTGSEIGDASAEDASGGKDESEASPVGSTLPSETAATDAATTAKTLEAGEGTGAAESVADDGDAAPTSTSETPDEASEIPSFMEEFTCPTQAEADGLPSLDDPSEAGGSPSPGVVGTGKLGVVGTRPTASTPATSDGGDAVVTTATASPAASQECAESSTGLARAAARLSPLLLPPCGKAVGLLERFDKLSPKLPDGARRLIGLVALATLGTGFFVLLLSMF